MSVNSGNPQPGYEAYLLRMWQMDVDGPWRFSLQSIDGREQHVFRSMADLTAFLEVLTAGSGQPADVDEESCSRTADGRGLR